jgi:O-antigen biosynthesis protein WbqP
MIRFFDIIFSFLGIIFLSPILILLWFIGLLENGSPLFFQKRIGYNCKFFVLIKFRSMPIKTKSVGTYLIKEDQISTYGNFLRKTKLDELPQLFNVLLGDMSLVGPRPCLLNQKKLITERKKKGIFKVKPGITGLSQISNVNMKTPRLLVKTDLKMIKKINLIYYFYYIMRTIFFAINRIFHF